MNDITPNIQPPANGLADNSHAEDSSIQPTPAAARPVINGGQPLRPVPRSGFSIDGTVTPGTRPISRPISRPMLNPRPIRRPNQDNNGYLRPVAARPLGSSNNNPVQSTAAVIQPTSTYPQSPSSPQLSPQYGRPTMTHQPIPQLGRPVAQQSIPQQQNPIPLPQKPTSFQPPQYWPPVSSKPVHQPAKVSPSKAAQLKSKIFKKHTLQLSLKGVAVIIVLVGATQLFSWFSIHYLSVYNKLIPAHYSNQNGLDFSFIHPAALSYNSNIAGQLKFTPVAYSYNLTSQKEALIDVSYTPIEQPLKALKLTPTELVAQVKVNSGTYINYLNKTSPGATDAYKNCNNVITTANGSDLMCTINGTNGTITHVINASSNYLYSLNLYIPKSIWGVHQNIWQKVEKSFSVQ